MVKKLDDFEGCLGEYLDTNENKEVWYLGLPAEWKPFFSPSNSLNFL